MKLLYWEQSKLYFSFFKLDGVESAQVFPLIIRRTGLLLLPNADLTTTCEAPLRLTQWFLNFYYSRHPSFVTEQFGGTHSYNLPVNILHFNKLTTPLEHFTAPKGSAAPRPVENHSSNWTKECVKMVQVHLLASSHECYNDKPLCKKRFKIAQKK